jgi:hypothetical protein
MDIALQKSFHFSSINDGDGQSKLDHVAAMLNRVVYSKQLPFTNSGLMFPPTGRNLSPLTTWFKLPLMSCKLRAMSVGRPSEFHRELKQLTGVEACQCRKARIQRNHIACALLV